MKKILLLISVVGFSVTNNTVNAQIRKIPARVTNAFEARYPYPRDVEWKGKFTVVQANFELNGNHCEAVFNRKGRWQRTTVMMSAYNLPSAIRDGLHKSKYNGWGIRSVYVTYLSNGKTHYHIEAAKSDLRKKELVFNIRGQLLSDNITI